MSTRCFSFLTSNILWHRRAKKEQRDKQILQPKLQKLTDGHNFWFNFATDRYFVKEQLEYIQELTKDKNAPQ